MDNRSFEKMIKEVENHNIDIQKIFQNVLANVYYYATTDDLHKGFRKYISINVEGYIKEKKAMKKKIKDVTIEEAYNLCNKESHCMDCPLLCICHGNYPIPPMFNLLKEELEKEIDL